MYPIKLKLILKFREDFGVKQDLNPYPTSHHHPVGEMVGEPDPDEVKSGVGR